MFAQKKYLSSIMINLFMLPYSFAYFSETTPSIEISNLPILLTQALR